MFIPSYFDDVIIYISHLSMNFFIFVMNVV